jgi:tripartite-type tricarboxylate transporter receptor subunit TctC
MNPLRTLCVGLALYGGLASQPPAARAQAIEKFYSGKTITVFIGFATGGGYDIYARLITRFMAMHLPGKPTILPRNMPGGGSRIAAGYVYNVAPKDGTTLATVSQSLPLEQALEQNANFDMTQFTWIGNPLVDNNTVVTWHTSGVRTIEDARTHEVPVGSTGADPSSHYPKVMNAVLGTKFKIVSGYPGGNEINLAMERGELGGRGSNSWTTWRATNPDWLRDHKINTLAQIGLKKADDLPDVPLLMDLAANADDRALLRLVSIPVTIGRPIFSTPMVPPDRVKALREAFDATMKDPAFLEQAEKAHLTIESLSGEALQKIVAEIAATPAAQLARLATILK